MLAGRTVNVAENPRKRKHEGRCSPRQRNSGELVGVGGGGCLEVRWEEGVGGNGWNI